MIKVNVFPPQRKSGRSQWINFSEPAILSIGLTLIVLSMLVLWFRQLYQDYHALLTEKEVKMVELEDLRKKSKQNAAFEKTYTAHLTRARLLKEPSGRKYSAVRLMESISRSLDTLSIWLLRVGVEGNKVEIEGMGLENEDIQKFVETLEHTAGWDNLLSIEMQEESYQNMPVYRFHLRFTGMGWHGE